MMKSDPRMIDELKPNQVFVFGSNESGFHGAGAAGTAFYDSHRNNGWRNDDFFQRAMKAPVGSQDRIGRWSVFGVGRGLQRGREGQSWGIVTIKRPGQMRSTSRREIYDQLVELVEYANLHPELEFLITPLAEGYAGYDREEMKAVWLLLELETGIPHNFTFVGRDWNGD